MILGTKRLCVLILGVLLGCTAIGKADPLVVKTAQGRAQGKTIGDGKVRAWLGVPYAAPPVGDLRWKAPQPAAAWQGVRDSTRYGAHCAQNHVFDDMIFQDNGPGEDCLFLNVFVPANAKAKARLPVMFWIHGGGFYGGASNEPRHNGDFLPQQGVVLVTMNYRLGVFGFLATSDLAKEAGGAAGNYGLMDMIAALQWVKTNIGNFGGDPGNVTIFGESAGSFAVSTLMAAPLARGLFHKAIGESGAAVTNSTLAFQPLNAREIKDATWVAGLKVHSLAELRALPTQTILDGAKQPGVSFPPDIDGKVLTEPVSATYKAGRQAHVPLIAGWNADEGASVSTREMSAEKWKSAAREYFPDRTEAFLRLYPGDTTPQAVRSATDFASDQFIGYGTWKWLEEHRTTGDASLFRYHFELPATPSKYHLGTYAFHSDDIEYVFGTLDTRPGFNVRPEDRILSKQMMTYWANFAKTGDPNGGDLPKWLSYKSAGYPLIHLDATITSGPDAIRDRYLFLEQGMPPRQR